MMTVFTRSWGYVFLLPFAASLLLVLNAAPKCWAFPTLSTRSLARVRRSRCTTTALDNAACIVDISSTIISLGEEMDVSTAATSGGGYLDSLMGSGLDDTTLLVGWVALLSLVGITALAITEEEDVSETKVTANQLEPTKEAKDKNTNPAVTSDKTVIAAPDLSGENDTDLDLATKEGDALKAFRSGDESGLRQSLSSLLGMVRSARASLKTERQRLEEEIGLRTQVESEVKSIAEDMRKLEDKYELGQNDLERTMRKLRATQEDLDSTKASLEALEEERRSLRKLGRAVYQLSKDRIKTRFQRVTNRFRNAKDESGAE